MALAAFTFCFGLIHGLGFCKFSRKLIYPISLSFITGFSFNVGVEIGQVIIICRRLFLLRNCTSIRKELTIPDLVSTCIVAIGLFWFVQRAFFFGVKLESCHVVSKEMDFFLQHGVNQGRKKCAFFSLEGNYLSHLQSFFRAERRAMTLFFRSLTTWQMMGIHLAFLRLRSNAVTLTQLDAFISHSCSPWSLIQCSYPNSRDK